MSQLPVPNTAAPEFTPEQRAYIVKYAAGLLFSWTENAVMHTITPDIGDGFDPAPAGLFPEPQDDEEEPLLFLAHGEVCSVLDTWLDEIAKLAGFSNLDEGLAAAGETETVYGKYPVMKADA